MQAEDLQAKADEEEAGTVLGETVAITGVEMDT